MQISKELPPNFDKICKAIPDVKDIPSIIFTYGDTVYNVQNELVDHLKQHESIHIQQQKQMGADEWWDKYLKDTDFRLQQELQAYRAQYKVVKKVRNWRYVESILSQISADLAGEMYGSIISKQEARTLITKAK